MNEHTTDPAAAIEPGDPESELRRRARRLCRQILRNQDDGEAFATLLLALGELARSEAFRTRPELARRAVAEAAAVIDRVERELAERVH